MVDRSVGPTPGPTLDGLELASGARVAIADGVVERIDRSHGQVLFGLGLRSGLDPAAAEDAVQETLVRLWVTVRSGTDVLDPLAWCFRTLYRLAMDQHRFRRRVRDVVERIGRRPVAPPVDVIQQMTIWSVVDRLPARQRQVLYLRYRADLTFDEIGLILDITPSGARASASKAMASLRRSLGPIGVE